jgi:hypothetical protein
LLTAWTLNLCKAKRTHRAARLTGRHCTARGDFLCHSDVPLPSLRQPLEALREAVRREQIEWVFKRICHKSSRRWLKRLLQAFAQAA